MTRLPSLLRFAAAVLLAGLLAACGNSVPREALELTSESLQKRQLQSRYFQTADESRVLAASAAVLQDLGFNLDESETELGVLVASKRRDAREVGQVVGAMLMTMLTFESKAYDREQEIRASLVTRPAGLRTGVRVTFQRTVWDTEGEITKAEAVEEAEIYQQFFDRLSKSVFLEAQLTPDPT